MYESFNWNALGNFLYDNGNYEIVVKDDYLSGESVFLVLGNGTYQGTYGDW